MSKSQLKIQANKTKKQKKILKSLDQIHLLGSPYSGKTTFLKHTSLLCEPINEEELKKCKISIQEKFVISTLSILPIAQNKGYYNVGLIGDLLNKIIKNIASIKKKPLKELNSISKLWEDPEFCKVIETIEDYELRDFFDYYFKYFKDFDAKYEINELDYLKHYQPTPNISQTVMSFRDEKIVLNDYPGIILNKTKYFDLISTMKKVIYFVPLDSYPYPCPNNPMQNRFNESLKHFIDITSGQDNLKFDLLIVFTRADQLEKTLRINKPNKLIKNYKGTNEMQSFKQFVQEKYVKWAQSCDLNVDFLYLETNVPENLLENWKKIIDFFKLNINPKYFSKTWFLHLLRNNRIEITQISPNSFQNFERDYKFLCNCLPTNNQIRKIDLTNCNLKSSHLMSLFESLSFNKSVKKLNFSGNRFNQKNFELISNWLKLKNSIETLTLRNCNIKNETCKQLSQAIIQNQNLKN